VFLIPNIDRGIAKLNPDHINRHTSGKSDDERHGNAA
jgi:hypothetical protein